MIQFRWTDETKWRDLEPRDYSKPVACQLARLRQAWRNYKRQYKLKYSGTLNYDQEFRVRT